MTDDPAPDGMSESPFADDPAGPADDPIGPDPDPAPDAKKYDLWGLRSDRPDVSPHEVGRQLDLEADWYEHLFCGLLKQSGSGVAEAWQHHLIAVVLLVDSEYGILDDDARDELDDERDEWGDLDG